MCRYLFHVRTGEALRRDLHGVEIHDPKQIISHVEGLADTLTADRTKLCDWGRSSIEIEDEQGRMFVVLSFMSILGRTKLATAGQPTRRIALQ